MTMRIGIFGLVTTLLIGLHSASFAAVGGGGEVGNGGGIAEKNITFAYINLSSYIDICLASASCQLSAQELPVLQAIRGGLSDEYLDQNQIIFSSETAQPGFFFLDGAIRVARTGSTVGSAIYYNRDLLYPVGPSGNITPFSVADAVGSLVHEMGHHHGIADHTFLDLLGSKVEKLMLGQIHSIDSNSQIRFSVETIDFSGASVSQLIVFDSETVTDLTGRLKTALRGVCPDTAPMSAANIANLHWKGLALGPMQIMYPNGQSEFTVDPISSILWIACGAMATSSNTQPLSAELYKLTIQLGIKQGSGIGQFLLVPEATTFKIEQAGLEKNPKENK
jgi:hypothetical protein